MKLNVPIFGQRDNQWSNKKLGSSVNTTIGSHGCVITSLAMLCKYYGKATNPAKFNDDTLKVNGFVNNNLYIWQSVNKIYPDIKNTLIKDYPLVPTPLNTIDAQLNMGKPVVAWVDLNPNQLGADHFILIIGKEENDYWINDPWYGNQVLFSTRYGDPVKFIFGHRFYSGPTPNLPDQTNWAEKYEACRLELKNRDAEKRFFEEIVIHAASLLNTATKKDEIEKAINELFNYQTISKELWKEIETKVGQQYTYPDAKQAILEAVRSLSVGSTVPVQPTPVITEKMIKEFNIFDSLFIRIFRKKERNNA